MRFGQRRGAPLDPGIACMQNGAKVAELAAPSNGLLWSWWGLVGGQGSQGMPRQLKSSRRDGKARESPTIAGLLAREAPPWEAPSNEVLCPGLRLAHDPRGPLWRPFSSWLSAQIGKLCNKTDESAQPPVART